MFSVMTQATWPEAFMAVGCAFAAALAIWAVAWGMKD